MPYKDTSKLPDAIKNHLPIKAQEIFLEAFNHAYILYKDPSKRKDKTSLEEVAFRVAWNAVKKSYHKNKEGKWVKN